jgi:RES domain-containing protein
VQAFRIAKTRHIRDLSGIGAMLHGGRWNRRNIPVVYASENRSLATVEFLVHVSLSIVPNDLSIACLEIPDNVVSEQISINDLPENWWEYPAPPELAKLGSEWALEKRSLLLRVPSVVVPNEFNILINPRHQEIYTVTISRVERYTFDSRLLRTRKSLERDK